MRRAFTLLSAGCPENLEFDLCDRVDFLPVCVGAIAEVVFAQQHQLAGMVVVIDKKNPQ